MSLFQDYLNLSQPRGRRISRLPRPLQPVAVAVRNGYLWYQIAISKRIPLMSSGERDVAQKLALGVEYVCSMAVEGDIAEFGTMGGRTASELARAMVNQRWDNAQSGPRTLHLFDSFKGLPKATSPVDSESPHVQQGVWEEGTCSILTEKGLRKMCRKWLPAGRIRTYPGWFADTLDGLAPDLRFALVHIDCDLYQSTIDVLDRLFGEERLSTGAALFFDDWNANRALTSCGERRAWTEIVEQYDVKFTDCGEYGAGCWKFIIHSYLGHPED